MYVRVHGVEQGFVVDDVANQKPCDMAETISKLGLDQLLGYLKISTRKVIMLAFLERDLPIQAYNMDMSVDVVFQDLRKMTVSDFLFHSDITKSKSEAKRLIQQNGIALCRKSGRWEKIKENDVIYLLSDEDLKTLFETYPDLIIEHDNLLI